MIFYALALYVGFLIVVAAVNLAAAAWILFGVLTLAGCIFVVDALGRDR